MNKKTKKTLVIISFIIVILVVAWWVGYFYKSSNTQYGLCHKADNTGWAPAFGHIGCDGEKLSNNSPLIEDGYACYCHTPDTCWNGEKCVELE